MMSLVEKYGVQVSEKEVFGFLLPYLERGMTEFLIILYYIDQNRWDGDVNNWKDKIVHHMVTTLEPSQRKDIFQYIEDSYEDK